MILVQGDIREETPQSTLEPHGLRMSLNQLGNFCLFYDRWAKSPNHINLLK